MRGRNKVDVVTTTTLQFQHHLGKAFVADLVLDLLFVRLGNLVVLTLDTAKIAIAKEAVPCASRSDQRWLFTEVGRVRGDNWQAAGITRCDLVFQPVVQAVARANSATLKQRLEFLNPSLQFTCKQQLEVRRFCG